MYHEIKKFKELISEKKGQRKQIESDLAETEKKISYLKYEIQFTETARAIIQKVARETQQQLEYHISELVTLALSGVFPVPYEFVVEFKEQRGKTECPMYFKRKGKKVDPLFGGGGGPLDVAAFALQPSIWSLKPTRNVLGLDEPFKYLSRNLQPKASEMLSEISKRLDLQILMITHSPELVKKADKVFKVSIKNGRSKIEKSTWQTSCDTR
jgi:DNA repair exonuclease SbcCD ATPase subunit